MSPPPHPHRRITRIAPLRLVTLFPTLPGRWIVIGCRIAIRRCRTIGRSCSGTGSRPNCDPRRNGTTAIVGPVSATRNDGCPSVRSADGGSAIWAAVGGTTAGSASRNPTGRPSGDRSAIGSAYCGTTHWAAIGGAAARACYGSPAEGIRRRQGQYRTERADNGKVFHFTPYRTIEADHQDWQRNGSYRRPCRRDD
jgi:hypothetical protein